VKGRTHLQDDRLFDCYVAERSGELMDPPAAEHLVDCADCAIRYGELARFMDGLRTGAEAEIDLVFTAERCAAQQQQIAKRIEHLGHAARVISFPGQLTTRRASVTPVRTAPRWLASAAAAGLVVGVGAGMLVDRVPGFRPAPVPFVQPAQRPVRPGPPVPASAPLPLVDDDTFLTQIEHALGAPNNRELLPFDALTPRVQDVSVRVR
jgi:hypothetical protein